MKLNRRAEDLRSNLILAGAGAVRPVVSTEADAGATADERMLLVELPEGETLLVTGGDIQTIPCEFGGEGRERYAAAQAVAWRRERERMTRRLRLPDELLQYCEVLQASRSAEEVHMALSMYASRVVGAHRAVVYLRERAPVPAPPAPGAHGAFPVELPRLGDGVIDRLLPTGLLTATDVTEEPIGRYTDLEPLFEEEGAVSLAYAMIAGEGILFLLERRRERVFNSEDWDLLCSLVRQAESALARIRLLQETSTLALTDPLTGLANRRHLEIVLEHCFAVARRGSELALVLIDLDDFKRVNDLYGHAAGDELLRNVAEALHVEARGSDVAARIGGDEFVLVLPDCSAAGARIYIERVRRRLGGRGSFSAGIATLDPTIGNPTDLLATADAALYRQKREKQAFRFGTHVPSK